MIREHGGALGLPAADLGDVLNGRLTADAVVVGLPFDGGVTSLPGQRHGPELFRKLSPDCGWRWESGGLTGVVDPVTRNGVLEGRRVVDVGDLGTVPIDLSVGRDRYYANVARLAQGLVRRGTTPIFIGGDHSLTAAILEGIHRETGPTSLLCFDAHCDFSHAPTDLAQVSHANFLGYLHREQIVDLSLVYGVRTLLPVECTPLPPNLSCSYEFDLDLDGGPDLDSGARLGERTYLSIDVDVLDVTEMPATGHPSPGGYRLRQLLDAVATICARTRPVAVDIVELAHDDVHNQRASAVVGEIVLTVLRTLFDTED